MLGVISRRVPLRQRQNVTPLSVSWPLWINGLDARNRSQPFKCRMKVRLFAALFLSCGGSALAGEWTRWEGVGGELISDRSAAVTARSRHDEAGDHRDKGHLFVYELHNQSGTLTAKVSLFFPQQDPATLNWSEIDRSHSPVVHYVPPMGTITGSRYSPSLRGLRYESDIKWSEDLTPKTTAEQASEAGKPDQPETGTRPPGEPTGPIRIERSGGSGGYTSSQVSEVIFRLPLDSKIIVDALNNGDMGAFPIESKTSFRAVIKVSRPAKFAKVSAEYQEIWVNQMLDSLKTDEKFGNIANLRILSRSNEEIRYSFERADWTTLVSQLENQYESPTIPEEVVLVSYTPPEPISPAEEPLPESAEKIVASTPEAKLGPEPEIRMASPKMAPSRHEGYWFDPGDKEAKATDPIIYVRVAGEPKRVKLSEAKLAYGVPASAASGSMSHYSEREGKVLIDRKTHLAR